MLLHRETLWLCTELQQGRFSNRGKSIFKADGIVATTTLLALRLYESRKRPSSSFSARLASRGRTTHPFGWWFWREKGVGIPPISDIMMGTRDHLENRNNRHPRTTYYSTSEQPRVPFIMDLVYPPLHCSRKSCTVCDWAKNFVLLCLLPVCTHNKVEHRVWKSLKKSHFHNIASEASYVNI